MFFHIDEGCFQLRDALENGSRRSPYLGHNSQILFNLRFYFTEKLLPDSHVSDVNASFAKDEMVTLSSNSQLLAHLWCAYAIPLALSVVRRPSSVVCVVSSNLTTADMKEII